uniref:Uncharacterized AAA domain-containing protein ycf46 n=1 Tax=Olisthodiscus luteus TaxID=83000 RepID=A0A7U0QGA6_OLILU|nr:conserved hypothetical plastid protein [Olisthodiscus luteus]QQW50470.1 conserved hypothetical plastid protein [Olisthodiscus luteus]
MKFELELFSLLKARYPILYLVSNEEDRVEYIVRKFTKEKLNRNIYVWNFVDGYQNNLTYKNFGQRNPLQALEFIEKLTSNSNALIILKDFQKFLSDISVLRKLKNLLRLLKKQNKTIVILATEVNIPLELLDFVYVLKLPLPNINEIRIEILRLLNLLNEAPDEKFLEILIQSFQGLSLEKIRRLLARILSTSSKFNSNALKLILAEKKQILNQTQILEYYSTNVSLEDIGGLNNLKLWIQNRSNAFSEKATVYGLPTPKGVLLVGIQGTGKSLTAKAIANEWKFPLLKLDVGRIFGSLVGESESRLRKMITIVEALAPCILWIDEFDKFSANLNTQNSNETTNRVFATLLTWLAEKNNQVFVIATANSMEKLPLEIVRKGRFDEIFFLNLPTYKERKKIFEVLLKKYRPDTFQNYNIVDLSNNSTYFSGAEIEQAIINGMLNAFNVKKDFNTHDILNSLQEIIPLAKVHKEEIEILQKWAFSGRIRCA